MSKWKISDNRPHVVLNEKLDIAVVVHGANAAQVVREHNAHDSLVAALENAIALIDLRIVVPGGPTDIRLNSALRLAKGDQ